MQRIVWIPFLEIYLNINIFYTRAVCRFRMIHIRKHSNQFHLFRRERLISNGFMIRQWMSICQNNLFDIFLFVSTHAKTDNMFQSVLNVYHLTLHCQVMLKRHISLLVCLIHIRPQNVISADVSLSSLQAHTTIYNETFDKAIDNNAQASCYRSQARCHLGAVKDWLTCLATVGINDRKVKQLQWCFSFRSLY